MRVRPGRMIAAVLLLASGATPLVTVSGAQPPSPASVQASPATTDGAPSVRVFDPRRNAFVDVDVVLAELSRADVVVVGEQHDSPGTHRFEAVLLQGFANRQIAVTVSLEMFERDVQPALDGYLAGRDTEAAFLKSSRPWPRYATDYRALVELARAQAWPVIAANVPRKYASEVAKGGLTTLDGLPTTERQQVARDLECPLDGYFERFAHTMRDHPDPPGAADPAAARRALLERYYQSQCVKDETMAESIAASVEGRAAGVGTVVHVTGAFHSDFGAGTAARVRRRLPSRRVVVLSVVPVTDLAGVVPETALPPRAEYIVYTLK